MLLTVAEFRDAVDFGLDSLVSQLRDLTGRRGDEEARAWRLSLPKLADALSNPHLAQMHVHFARREHCVEIEYPLPGTSAWCDAVLIGSQAGTPAVVIIELKHWDTATDRPGAWEGLIERWGVQELHPSEQTRGYVHYCRRFHAAVLDRAARVHGCVLFTSTFGTHAYQVTPNDALVREIPVFTTRAEDVQQAFPSFLQARLTESDPGFAREFDEGGYRQDRSFLRQIGGEILGSEHEGAFELLDNQRRAFALCRARVNTLAAERAAHHKKVIIVDGPPGSGKSAVAARLWASLVSDPDLRAGNISIVTTSQSQSSNWVHLIDRAAGERAGWGVARKATQFSPLTIHELNRLRNLARDRELYRDAAQWKSHLVHLRSNAHARVQHGAEDDSHLVCLVDEAHALINPEREFGVGQYGFVTGLGPQAFHIIRASRMTVFFIDPAQSFRLRENTRIEDIERWAAELGASIEHVSLAGAQFRCAGSAEYVSWVDSLLGGASAEVNRVHASAWQAPQQVEPATENGPDPADWAANVIPLRRASPGEPRAEIGVGNGTSVVTEGLGRYEVRATTSRLEVRLFDNPFGLERALRAHHPGDTIRLVSSYSRPWVTQNLADPHLAPSQSWDFHETVAISGRPRVWARPWNVVPGGTDYTPFVQGRPGSRMHADPLCEVGCTYAVRGFDFHYVGLIWLDDLVWRDGAWQVNVERVHESGIGILTNRVRNREGPIAPAGPEGKELVAKVCQAYRILMTRSIKGLYLWVPDSETREHLQASLAPGAEHEGKA